LGVEVQVDEDYWLSLVDAFSAAAIGTGSWLDALSGLAAGTGSRVGELIGLGSANTVPFNWVTDLGADWVEDFIAIGGGDPDLNPHVRVGSQAAELQVLSSAQFITREERRTNPLLAVHTKQYDIPYICLTPLIKSPVGLVGLAVLRSESEGEISDQQRAIFTSLAPHVRTAVRTQMALEEQGARLMAGALEAVSLAAFICDWRGMVKAMTPTAEALLGEQGPLSVRGGLLGATHPAAARSLALAIEKAAAGHLVAGAPVASTLILPAGLEPQVLEVIPLPRREYAFGFEPRVLVVARGGRPDAGRIQLLLQSVYGLTLAEADVAQRLADGQPTELIAEQRSASLGTVRSQIRSIYGKLNVHRANELVARLNQLR
jgi:DNA-binding CsgD family transcriptional regulator